MNADDTRYQYATARYQYWYAQMQRIERERELLSVNAPPETVIQLRARMDRASRLYRYWYRRSSKAFTALREHTA